jgi:hypothetical protein
VWTAAFWLASAERAAKTAAQVLLSLFFVGDVALDVFRFDWLPALGIVAGAVLISVLTSILSAPVTGTPSLVGEPPAHD